MESVGVAAHVFPVAELGRVWSCYDGIVYVGAIGGIVRLLCPLLRDKELDPPVVAVDRSGRFFVPLLGGHWGANELASELAKLLGGVAVITTAVEHVGAVPPEELERIFLCRMERSARLRVAAALRDGAEVCVAGVSWAPPGYKLGEGCAVVVRRGHVCKEGEVCCRPVRLYVGFGATSSATVEDVVEAIKKALGDLGVSKVEAVASVKVLASEVGRALGVRAVVYTPEELRTDEYCASPPSPKALEALGVPGVAELAALTAAGPGGRLVYRKRVFGKVTVAVAAAP